MKVVSSQDVGKWPFSFQEKLLLREFSHIGGIKLILRLHKILDALWLAHIVMVGQLLGNETLHLVLIFLLRLYTMLPFAQLYANLWLLPELV